MRKSLWVLFAVLLAGIGAPAAHADSFTDGTITFTVTGGGPSPTGSFVYDNTTATFTSFTVSWDGATFNLAPGADFGHLAGLELSAEWCAEAATAVPSDPCGRNSFIFGILPPALPSGSFTSSTAFAVGSYTISETAVSPEPGTERLLLIGIGLLGLVMVGRKRIVQDLPKAT